MIDARQLRDELIIPTLQDMAWFFPGADRPAAINLMIGTASKESHAGTYVRQLGGGPAEGLCQVEPDTEASLWANYLRYKPARCKYVMGLLPKVEREGWYSYLKAVREVDRLDSPGRYFATPPKFGRLVYDMRYNLVIARLKYYARSFDWPEDPNDIQGLAEIWDRIYNVNNEHGWPHEFVELFPMEILE